MYLIPVGLFLAHGLGGAAFVANEAPGAGAFAAALVPVTLGNILGGAGLVGLVYWVIYRRGADRAGSSP